MQCSYGVRIETPFGILEMFSIRRKLRIWSYLLKKSVIENFIFCAVSSSDLIKIYKHLHCYETSARGVQTNPFYYHTVKTWNELPEIATLAKNINMFKTKLNEV